MGSRPGGTCVPRPLALLGGLLVALAQGAVAAQEAVPPPAAPASLHEWTDARGVLHRSNLPRAAFGADGRPLPEWDPKHPASQEAALRERLMARERELRDGAPVASPPLPPAATTP